MNRIKNSILLLIPLLLTPLLLGISAWAGPSEFRSVINLKMGMARQGDSGKLIVPDQTGNGYDLAIPSGAIIEPDPGLSNRQALVWSGSANLVPCSIHCVEMPNLVCSFKVKPSASAVANSEIIGVDNAWGLRFNAATKQLTLFTKPTIEGSVGNPSSVNLSIAAKVGEWNDIGISIASDRVEFRVNESLSEFSFGLPIIKFSPIPDGRVAFFRRIKSGRFVGSISDVSVGYKAPKDTANSSSANSSSPPPK